MPNFGLAIGVPDVSAIGSITIVTKQGELNVSIVPLAGGAGSGQSVLTFPTIAALSAYDIVAGGSSNGQLAAVLSNGSLWALSSNLEGLVADGITIATVTGGPTQIWQRTTTNLFLEKYLVQQAWHIDPALGNDESTGLDAAHPIQHKAEIYRRWGYTWTPNLVNVSVVITYHSSDLDDSDPGFFAPNFIEVASLTHTAARPAAGFTGTLNVVTAKNRAANQSLTSSFNVTTGAVANGMMMVNHTRGESIAWVVDGGPVFRLSQPCAPYAGGDATIVTEVDTWAPGDSVSGFALVQVVLASLGGRTGSFILAGAQPQHIVNNIEISDPTGGSSAPLAIDGEGNVAIVECFVARNLSMKGAWAFTTIANCLVPTTTSSIASLPLNVSLRAGAFASVDAWGAGALFDEDTMLLSEVQGFSLGVGTAFIDAGHHFSPLGGLSAIAGPLYGPGDMNAQGVVEYIAPATTSLPLAAGLLITGSPNAYSTSTPGGVGTATAINLVALTAAHLDAAAGAAGFGGLAWLGGSCITTGGVAP